MQVLDIMKAESGNTIFISGGTGSVRAMAIPIAKAKGLKVITNGSADNKERVLELGVSRFIDCKTEDYAKVLSNVDYVLDTLGRNETEKQMTILKKDGKISIFKSNAKRSICKENEVAEMEANLFGIVGRKFDKLAAKYGVTYDFIFVNQLENSCKK